MYIRARWSGVKTANEERSESRTKKAGELLNWGNNDAEKKEVQGKEPQSEEDDIMAELTSFFIIVLVDFKDIVP